MPRCYCFELFYPAARTGDGLWALHGRLPALRQNRAGKRVTSGNWDAASFLRCLTPDSPILFQTSLLFPADEHVRAFCADWADGRTEWDDDGNEYLPVGSINVTLRTGLQYAAFTYAAVTSSMSDLFERSRSVWGEFDEMLRESGGLAAIFRGRAERRPAAYPVLPDGERKVAVEYRDFILEERSRYWHIDVDRYAAAVLDALGSAG